MKILHVIGYLLVILIVPALWKFTDDLILKVLVTLSCVFIFASIVSHNNKKKSRLICLVIGLVGMLYFFYHERSNFLSIA